MRQLVIWLIRLTRLAMSPLIPTPCCRFSPGCTTYAMQSVAKHGVMRGGWLAARRLVKCHPFHPGGYDPVP